MVFRVPHALNANLGGLGAVIGYRHLAEPRVLESLSSRDPLGRVVDEDLLQKIQEQLQEGTGARDNVLRVC